MVRVSPFLLAVAAVVAVLAAVPDAGAFEAPPLVTTAAAELINDTTTTVITAIHDIQGAAHISPLNNQSLSTQGIVTGKRSNGFYMQQADGTVDADVSTSEGIFVFTSTAPTVNVGDDVTVTGTVAEFRADSTSLTTTEITSPVVSVNSTGNPLPAPTIIGAGGRMPPNTVVEDDATGDVETSGFFDAASDGIDFYESLEGMRAAVNEPVVVGPTLFGELPVLADDGADASVRTTRGGIVIRSNDFNPERIILDDEILLLSAGTMPVAKVADHLTGSVVGVVDYSFGSFKLELTSTPTLVPGALAQETAVSPAANEISIATFNVNDLDPGDGPGKFNALAAIIVNNLKAPDIIALEEIQDNNGPTNDSVVDASTTYSALFSAITAAGGPSYQFRQIDPVDDQDGGEPGGNIRVGFIFRTDRGVSFVDKPGAGSTTANTVGAGGLAFSPGRIDPTNPAFNSSRKPLAAEFMLSGQKLYLIANHFNSKSGDDPLFGRFQPPTLFSEVQRNQQAQIVNNFVDSILANDTTAQVVVLGDLSDYEFSTPLQTLLGGVLANMHSTLPQPERYSFVLEGNSQALDHILVSGQIMSRAPVYDAVHVNAEFANPISDHDPQVLRYNPIGTPTAVEVTTLAARRAGRSVLIRWRTRTEARIAGFHLYRESGSKLTRLNVALIRAKQPGGTSGASYVWRDAAAHPGAQYRLQVVHLNGTRTWAGRTRLGRP